MSKITIELDQETIRELERRGAREGKSTGQVASQLLSWAVAIRAVPEADFVWRSADLGTAFVDLEDAEAVRRALARG